MMKRGAVVSVALLLVIVLLVVAARQHAELAALRTSERSRELFCNYHRSALRVLSYELEQKPWTDRTPRAMFDFLTTEPVLQTCMHTTAQMEDDLMRAGTCDVLDKSYRCLIPVVNELLSIRE